MHDTGSDGVKSRAFAKIERIIVQAAQGAYSLQPLGEPPQRATLSLGHVSARLGRRGARVQAC